MNGAPSPQARRSAVPRVLCCRRSRRLRSTSDRANQARARPQTSGRIRDGGPHRAALSRCQSDMAALSATWGERSTRGMTAGQMPYAHARAKLGYHAPSPGGCSPVGRAASSKRQAELAVTWSIAASSAARSVVRLADRESGRSAVAAACAVVARPGPDERRDSVEPEAEPTRGPPRTRVWQRSCDRLA